MAGEIQLNSTTMATESSGTITLSNVNSATNRTNLGLGSMATQNANAVALTGGSLTGTEIDLKSSGTTIYASNGSTAVLSESGGVVTLGNATLSNSVVTDTKTIQTFKSTSQIAITASGFGGTNTNYDQGFSVASDFASITEGSGITTSTPSSGDVTKFLFPTVGKYLISFTYILDNDDNTSSQVRQFQLKGVFSNDNGTTYTDPNNIISDVKVNIERLDSNTVVTGTSIPFLFSVTDTSNDVFGFQYRFFSASDDFYLSAIGVTFIRI